MPCAAFVPDPRFLHCLSRFDHRRVARKVRADRQGESSTPVFVCLSPSPGPRGPVDPREILNPRLLGHNTFLSLRLNPRVQIVGSLD